MAATQAKLTKYMPEKLTLMYKTIHETDSDAMSNYPDIVLLDKTKATLNDMIIHMDINMVKADVEKYDRARDMQGTVPQG